MLTLVLKRVIVLALLAGTTIAGEQIRLSFSMSDFSSAFRIAIVFIFKPFGLRMLHLSRILGRFPNWTVLNKTLWSMEDIAALVEARAAKPGRRGTYKRQK